MMGTPQCCQFNCMELTKDRFPRLRTNKVDPISVLGALEDIPSYDDPLSHLLGLNKVTSLTLFHPQLISTEEIKFSSEPKTNH